jgi:hypothetical protein
MRKIDVYLRSSICVAASFALISFSAPSQCAEILQEVELKQSINVLPDKVSGFSMIEKTWENSNDANNHFSVNLYTSKTKPTALDPFYERVMVFAHGVKQDFIEHNGPDCSISQTAVFRTPASENSLIVVTAKRVERNDKTMPSQAEPRPQRLQLFEVRSNVTGEPGKSSLWLEATKESVTEKTFCDADSIHKAMADFAQN